MLFFALALLIFSLGPASLEAAVKTEEVTYQDASGTNLKGFLAYDDAAKDPAPGVLVIHEWWGHNDYVRRRAKMLAEMGYVAFALDMYGEGKLADHPKDAGAFAEELRQNQGLLKDRFLAGLEYLEKNPHVDSKKIAAIGYCFGGGTVLEMAREGAALAGVVSFHGSLATENPAKAGQVRAKILVCHGAADHHVSEKDIHAFKEEMQKAGADYRFLVYEGAKHGFTNPEADALAKKFELSIGYNAAADQKSWQDMRHFLEEAFHEGP